MDEVGGVALEVFARCAAGVPEEVAPERTLADETQVEGFFGARYEGVLDIGCGLVGRAEVRGLGEDVEAGLRVRVRVGGGGGGRHCGTAGLRLLGAAVWWGGGGSCGSGDRVFSRYTIRNTI